MTSNSNISAPSPSAPKEKIHTIMEAASALTALGDEDSSASSHGDHTSTTGLNGGTRETAEETAPKKTGLAASSKTPPATKKQKRYLPNHKKPDAAPTFPEKLMRMMQYAETQGDDFCVAWLDDGNSFVIRNFDEFTRSVVPLYFKATKFASFTRKLYRWGFRQVNRGIGPDDPIIFGNEHFKRDHPEEMANMKSVTAASARKAEEEMAVSPAPPSSSSPMFGSHSSSNTNNMMSMNHNNNVVSGMKRSFEDHVSDHQQLNDNHHKRALFDHMFQQHHQKVSATMSTQQPSLYGVASQSMQPLPMNGQQYQQQQYQHQTNVQPQQQQQLMRQSPTFEYVNRNGGNMMMNNNYNVNTNNNNYNNGGNNYQNISNDQQQQYNQGGNSFMNQFVPPQQQHGGNNNNNCNMNSQYPSANSTAEIVNAAIAALRYA